MRQKVFAGFCASGLYLIINLWYPGRDEYYAFSEIYLAFKRLYSVALGVKGVK